MDDAHDDDPSRLAGLRSRRRSCRCGACPGTALEPLPPAALLAARSGLALLCGATAVVVVLGW